MLISDRNSSESDLPGLDLSWSGRVMARPSRALNFMSGRTAVFSLDVWRALDFMSGLNAQLKSVVAVALAQISEAASSYSVQHLNLLQ